MGLAADALNPSAIQTVFRAKQRSENNPLLVLVKDQNAVEALVKSIPPAAEILMQAFWPGSLTMVFSARADLPPALTAGTNKIGIRIPVHPAAAALVNMLDTPITGTSANLSLSGRLPSSLHPARRGCPSCRPDSGCRPAAGRSGIDRCRCDRQSTCCAARREHTGTKNTPGPASKINVTAAGEPVKVNAGTRGVRTGIWQTRIFVGENYPPRRMRGNGLKGVIRPDTAIYVNILFRKYIFVKCICIGDKTGNRNRIGDGRNQAPERYYSHEARLRRRRTCLRRHTRRKDRCPWSIFPQAHGCNRY